MRREEDWDNQYIRDFVVASPNVREQSASVVTIDYGKHIVVVAMCAALVAIAFAVYAWARVESMERSNANQAAVYAARIADLQQRFDTRVNDIALTVDARLSDAALTRDELRRDNRIMADDLRTIRVVLNTMGLPSSHEETEESNRGTSRRVSASR